MESPLSSNDRFTVSPNALFERLGEEGVILDTRTDIYFGLNAAGSYVWETIAGGKSVEDAAALLFNHFPISLDTARLDTVSLIEELLDRQLVHRVASQVSH